MYVKEQLEASIVDDLCVSKLCVETLGIRLNLKYTKPIFIIGIYGPPEQPVEDCISELDGLIDILYLNINRLKGNNVTRLLREFMMRHGLKNLINSPTCYGANFNDASSFDLFLTTDEVICTAWCVPLHVIG